MADTVATCKVCYERVPVHSPYDDDSTDLGHPAESSVTSQPKIWTCPKNPVETVCTACINAYTSSRLDDGNIHIPCPADYDVCSHVLDEKELLPLLRPDVATKYARTCALVLNPSARICPNPNCGGIVTSGSTAKPNLKCDKCDLCFCFVHGSDHGETQCPDTTRTAWQHMPLQWFRSARTHIWCMWRTKPCPKCKARIQKSGGCNHMTCRCGFEICWKCGGPYVHKRSTRRGHDTALWPSSWYNRCRSWKMGFYRVGSVLLAIVVSPVVVAALGVYALVRATCWAHRILRLAGRTLFCRRKRRTHKSWISEQQHAQQRVLELDICKRESERAGDAWACNYCIHQVPKCKHPHSTPVTVDGVVTGSRCSTCQHFSGCNCFFSSTDDRCLFCHRQNPDSQTPEAVTTSEDGV